MTIQVITLEQYASKKAEWLNKCPYAVLRFISCNRNVSHAHLPHFLVKMGIDDIGAANEWTDLIIDALLKSGNIVEIHNRVYAALPPYSIQLDSEEWMILGDTRVDIKLIREEVLFEVASKVDKFNIYLRRILVCESTTALQLFHHAGIRCFSRDDVLSLIPEIKQFIPPTPWPGFEPYGHTKWDVVDDSGRWMSMPLQSSIRKGVCRGSTEDETGKMKTVRYYFKHEDGWSPLTHDDVSVWMLKRAAETGRPYNAAYIANTATLSIPARIPSSAYVVLRLIGQESRVNGETFIVRGVNYQTSEKICNGLGIKLLIKEG